MTERSARKIYVLSDAVGETADAVVRAMLRQFEGHTIEMKRFGHIKSEEEIRFIVNEAADGESFIAYTLVQPELREMLRMESIRLGIRAVDIMGPMMQAYIDTFNGSPKSKPGLLHEMDEDYFRRVEAVEFAVKSDDGKDTSALLKADIVLIGVSRTSKTPLSIFLAHKGKKVANFPLIPEVKPPKELFQLPSGIVMGLTMKPDHLVKVRSERLKAVGLPDGAKYADVNRIRNELRYAEGIMDRLGCPVIDVSDKAIEETAGFILGYV